VEHSAAWEGPNVTSGARETERSGHPRREQPSLQEEALSSRIGVEPRGAATERSVVGARAEELVHEAQETDLLERALERGNTGRALRRVERNRGAPGVDGMEVGQLRAHLQVHWPKIREQLLRTVLQVRDVSDSPTHQRLSGSLGSAEIPAVVPSRQTGEGVHRERRTMRAESIRPLAAGAAVRLGIGSRVS
jgi:hypothetical protein